MKIQRLLAFVFVFVCAGTNLRAAELAPSRLLLDARQAPTGVMYAHMTFAATPGTLTLAYPKWIPGEHAPGGPLGQMVRLTFAGNGKRLKWRRDDLDIYLFHVEVPEGVSEVVADLDFACVLGAEGFQSSVCSSHNQLALNWWLVVLYPPDRSNDQNPFSASIMLPAGWRFRTALPVDGRANSDGIVHFKTVSLQTLVDSPLIAAQHLRTFALGGRSRVELDLTAESEAGLAISEEQLSHFSRLVAENEAVFGGARYPHYNLMLSLGDEIDHYTLEHLQSSDNRLPANGLLDPRVLLTTASMIPHEYIHAWNGKFRTPVGLDIRTYQDPMKAALIWVYEGLTDYVSNVVTARSGFWSVEQLADSLAIDAAQMTYHTGRTWRSLQDTTVGAQMLFSSANAWSSARRNMDFYPESGLVWLEVDTLIRQMSKGKRTLDDFCRLFFSEATKGAPYSIEDVIKGLTQIQPYDWSTFLRTRLESLDPTPPMGGIENAGWKLVYTETKSELVADLEQVHKVDLLWPDWHSWGHADLRYSIGLLLQDDGTVLDSAPGMSGYNAGIMPGMVITGINGAAFTLGAMEEAVRATKQGARLTLAVKNGGLTSPHVLDYHEGLKYPHLVRDASKPDLLRVIAAASTRVKESVRSSGAASNNSR